MVLEGFSSLNDSMILCTVRSVVLLLLYQIEEAAKGPYHHPSVGLPHFRAWNWLVSHASGKPQVSTLQPLTSTTSMAWQAMCQSWHHMG